MSVVLGDFPEVTERTPEWYDIKLHQMCEAGAHLSATRPGATIRFDVMGCEVEKVRSYMAEHHPNVRYFTTAPRGLQPDAAKSMAQAGMPV